MPARVFKEEEKETLKGKMLDAGLPLLKQYGLTHMSVAKITDAAGIGTSTFIVSGRTRKNMLLHFQRIRKNRFFRRS